MREPEPSDDLLDLIFAALDLGIESVEAAAGGMHPFLMTPGDDKPTATRFTGGPILQCVERARQAAAELPPGVTAYAIAADGRLPADGETFDAVIVEAAERGQPAGFVFAQRYRPAAPGRRFEAVGPPAIIQEVASRFG